MFSPNLLMERWHVEERQHMNSVDQWIIQTPFFLNVGCLRFQQENFYLPLESHNIKKYERVIFILIQNV